MAARARLMVGMCGATMLSLLGSAAYSSTLPRLARAWDLDATHAGWIGSAYFAGYAVACAALIRLSSRMPPVISILRGRPSPSSAAAVLRGSHAVH